MNEPALDQDALRATLHRRTEEGGFRAPPIVPRLVAPPDAVAIERLGVSLAAACGHAWAKLDVDARLHYRMLANAALFHLGTDAGAIGGAHITKTLDDMVAIQRAAADALEGVREDLVARLHRSASAADMMALMVGDDPGDAETI